MFRFKIAEKTEYLSFMSSIFIGSEMKLHTYLYVNNTAKKDILIQVNIFLYLVYNSFSLHFPRVCFI